MFKKKINIKKKYYYQFFHLVITNEGRFFSISITPNLRATGGGTRGDTNLPSKNYIWPHVPWSNLYRNEKKNIILNYDLESYIIVTKT